MSAPVQGAAAGQAGPSHRVFFALWPGEPLRRMLAERVAARVTPGMGRAQRPDQLHLTLARKVDRPPDLGPAEPLHWPATDFVLVESVTERSGSVYRPLAAWPLQAREGGEKLLISGNFSPDGAT